MNERKNLRIKNYISPSHPKKNSIFFLQLLCMRFLNRFLFPKEEKVFPVGGTSLYGLLGLMYKEYYDYAKKKRQQ